jgi:hypothetical protein
MARAFVGVAQVHKELSRLASDEGCGEAPGPCPRHLPGEMYAWQPEEQLAALEEVRDHEVGGEAPAA